jgi:hypothetical protein
MELLPAGKYRAQIVESEMRVTRNGMGQFLWLIPAARIFDSFIWF